MEQEQKIGEKQNVAGKLTDRLKEIWANFLEEFQQSFDLNQLDLVFSVLKELESSSQNPTKKKRTQLIQKEEASTENNNYHQLALEKKVFGNHLLAKQVFKNLPRSTLFSCRFLSSYWNEFATDVLLQSDNKIQFERNINRFYLNGTNWKSLDMFTEFLKQSKKFPCNKFEFYGGNLGNDDAQRFFSFYGSNIKSLKISFDDNQIYSKDVVDKETGFSLNLTDSRIIGAILTQNLPNLEELELNLNYEGDFEWSGHESLLFPPEKKVKLPNLKTLTCASIRDDDPLLRQILVAARNLTRFELKHDYFDMDGLDNFTQTGKVKCITDLSFPTEAERLQKLNEMVKHEPQLTYLSLYKLTEIYDHSQAWIVISIILTDLLESSKKSLNQLDYLRSLGFLPQLHLPVLENVKHLDFFVLADSTFKTKDVHDYIFACLPKGATFSNNFPGLNSLTFEFESEISSDDAADWWRKCFPSDEIVSSVKKLDICGFCPILWMEKFSEMFPNLETLSVSNIKDFRNFSKILWKSCRKLKNLTIGIDVSSSANAHPALDSSFTGISPEVCKKLDTLSKSTLESVAENYMENQPSLLDLTELKTLQINLEFNSDALNYRHSKFISPLTGICAFRALKNLQVDVHCSNLIALGFNESLLIQDLELLTPYKVTVQK